MAEQIVSNKIVTIPNILSFLRILVIPVFAWAYMTDRLILALVIVALSGLSDTLDGTIARATNQISSLGKILDPLADKLSQVALAVLLFVKFSGSADIWMQRFAWVFLLFVLKEVLMLLVSLVLLTIKLRPVPPSFWGKFATVVFYLVMTILFLAGPDVGVLAHYLGWALPTLVMQILIVLALVLTFVAFFSYFPDTIRQFIQRSRKAETENNT